MIPRQVESVKNKQTLFLLERADLTLQISIRIIQSTETVSSNFNYTEGRFKLVLSCSYFWKFTDVTSEIQYFDCMGEIRKPSSDAYEVRRSVL